MQVNPKQLSPLYHYVRAFLLSTLSLLIGAIAICNCNAAPDQDKKSELTEQIAPCVEAKKTVKTGGLCKQSVAVGGQTIESNRCLNVGLAQAIEKIDLLNADNVEITTDDYLNASLSILSALTKNDVDSILSQNAVSGEWLSHPEIKRPFEVLLNKGKISQFLDSKISIDDPNLRIELKYEASMRLLEKEVPVTGWMGYFDYGKNISVDGEKGELHSISSVPIEKSQNTENILLQKDCRDLKEVVKQNDVAYSAAIEDSKIFIPAGKFSTPFLLTATAEALNLNVRTVGNKKFVTPYSNEDAVDRLSEFVLRRFDPPVSIPQKFRVFKNGATIKRENLGADEISFIKQVIRSEMNQEYNKLDLRSVDVKLYNSLTVNFTYFSEGGFVYVYKIGLL